MATSFTTGAATSAKGIGTPANIFTCDRSIYGKYTFAIRPFSSALALFDPLCVLTSLQRVFGNRTAVDAQAGAGVGGHLDLVLCPDDQFLQQAVVGLRTADVLLLVVAWKPRETVPSHRRVRTQHAKGC